eukprot:TRINITY_DN1463_c0_g2_i1.p1 TRINITY_DN1463_c0_g2~~TRINITY_DN1463_c0_g2_i1.p1  ORF type:complete len:409 (+),score=52.88 TRINITY_DN1463_c0_g2_i1:132-1358(+)
MSIDIEAAMLDQTSSLQKTSSCTSESLVALIKKFETMSSDESERAFNIINLDDIVEKYRQWTNLLPRVTPYYAVQCNPDTYICRELARLGINFACVSIGEIEIIESVGVTPDRIIFSHPMKSPSHVLYAKQRGINLTVFDSKDELYKLRDLYPSCRLLIRIAVDDSHSVCQLDAKFGVQLKDVETLLSIAKEIGANVVGVAFNLHPGCINAQAYEHAIQLARSAFDIAEQIGFNFEVLDIGGGYPGTWGQDLVSFPAIASLVSTLLDRLFPNATIISEPGRYFVGSCSTLVTRVIGKRETLQPDGSLGFSYYLNDGLYGSLNVIIFDHYTPMPIPLKDCTGCPTYNTTIFGPTCDSLDKIISDHPFPQMCIGDVIYFLNMGAYSTCCGSEFNGFLLPNIHYIRFSELL